MGVGDAVQVWEQTGQSEDLLGECYNVTLYVRLEVESRDLRYWLLRHPGLDRVVSAGHQVDVEAGEDLDQEVIQLPGCSCRHHHGVDGPVVLDVPVLAAGVTIL